MRVASGLLSPTTGQILIAGSWAEDRGFEPALEMFPLLRERWSQTAGSMSGGQQ